MSFLASRYIVCQKLTIREWWFSDIPQFEPRHRNAAASNSHSLHHIPSYLPFVFSFLFYFLSRGRSSRGRFSRPRASSRLHPAYALFPSAEVWDAAAPDASTARSSKSREWVAALGSERRLHRALWADAYTCALRARASERVAMAPARARAPPRTGQWQSKVTSSASRAFGMRPDLAALAFAQFARAFALARPTEASFLRHLFL